MTEYPEDIMEIANDFTVRYSAPDCFDDLLKAVADALKAERERCADIARNAQGPEEAYEAIMTGDV